MHDVALVSILVGPKFQFCRCRPDGVEAEKADRIESAIRVAAMGEFTGAGGYFIFSHVARLYPHKANVINCFASNFLGMEIQRQMAYMGPHPASNSDEARLRELCLSLDTELEVVANLISLATRRPLEADECDQYLETARAAIDRIRRIVLKNC